MGKRCTEKRLSIRDDKMKNSFISFTELKMYSSSVSTNSKTNPFHCRLPLRIVLQIELPEVEQVEIDDRMEGTMNL